MNKSEYLKRINETANYIKDFFKQQKFELALILGSGLNSAVKEFNILNELDYKDIPNFNITTVPGHQGKLVCVEIFNKIVLIMQGRFHYYEGYHPWELVFPIRVFKPLGVKILFLTNAVGAINSEYQVGDFIILKDQINFMGFNPLIGQNLDEFGPRFPDMSEVFDKYLRELLKKSVKEAGKRVIEGVYIGLSGPCYETPAEIRMYRLLGADVIGMSVIPESIVAVHQGIKVIALSLVTNMAAGLSNKKLSHKEVQETGQANSTIFARIFKNFIKKI